MGFHAIKCAFDQAIQSATQKYILVCLACHADDGELLAWPCVQTICEKTGLNRKTVIAGLDALQKDGWIEDTGDRCGNTKQVKIYRLKESQKRHSLNGAVNGTVEGSQKRNGSVSGTVPVLPAKGPVFTRKGSQKGDTDQSGSVNEVNPPLPPKGGEKEASKDQIGATEAERDAFIAEFTKAKSERLGSPCLGNASDKTRATKLIKRAKLNKLPIDGIMEMVRRAWKLQDDDSVHGSQKIHSSRLYNLGYLEAHYDDIKGEILNAVNKSKRNDTTKNENTKRNGPGSVNGNTGTLNRPSAEKSAAYDAIARRGIAERVPNSGQPGPGKDAGSVP